MKDKYDFIHGCTSDFRKNLPTTDEVVAYICVFVMGFLTGIIGLLPV